VVAVYVTTVVPTAVHVARLTVVATFVDVKGVDVPSVVELEPLSSSVRAVVLVPTSATAGPSPSLIGSILPPH
jgi:hypothetical protein